MQLTESPRPAVRPNGSATPQKPSARHPHRRLIIAVVVAVALATIVAAVILMNRRPTIVYQTVPATHRALLQAVTATGTVNPQDTISVGSQLSGTILELNADYNSRVHRGQVLARLDPTAFQAAAEQARSTVAQSESQLAAALGTLGAATASAQGANATVRAGAASAQSALETARAQRAAIAAASADLAKARSALSLARATFARDRQLLAQGFIARSQYDADANGLVAAEAAVNSASVTEREARAQSAASAASASASLAQNEAQGFAHLTAAAQRVNAEAQVDAQRSAIAIQRAQLAQAEINLQRTVIVSPVDGTVVARNVSVGQTVAASFQTPTLFTIARDLHKMELDIAVGEPDVGNVRRGQHLTFSVLAYPARVFGGTVSMVRQNPTTVQNVVTYTTVAYVDNREGLLRPGMTTNATIEIAKATSGTVVPLQALTYLPPAMKRARASSENAPRNSVWGQTATSGATGASVSAGAAARLFILTQGAPVAVPVRVLLVAGTDAAVVSTGASIADAAPVVVSDSTVTSRATNTVSASNTTLRSVR